MEERIKTEWKKAFSFNFEEKLNAHTQKLNKKKEFPTEKLHSVCYV